MSTNSFSVKMKRLVKKDRRPDRREALAGWQDATENLKAEFDRLDADPFFNTPRQDVFELEWNDDPVRIELRRHGDLIGCWAHQHSDAHYVFVPCPDYLQFSTATPVAREIPNQLRTS